MSASFEIYLSHRRRVIQIKYSRAVPSTLDMERLAQTDLRARQDNGEKKCLMYLKKNPTELQEEKLDTSLMVSLLTFSMNFFALSLPGSLQR